VNTCIVLAGGLGTRLRSEISDLPKCLAPVGHRSFLEVQLEWLARHGVDRFVLSLGFMAEKVIASVRSLRVPFQIDSIVEPRPLGTGGALGYAFARAGVDEALVINGDTYVGGDLVGMLRPLEPWEAFRLAVVSVADATRFGRVILAGARVAGFSEKGSGGEGLINAGIYRVSGRALAAVTDARPYSLENELLPSLIQSGLVGAEQVSGPFVDIGVPDDYRRFVHEHA
jgi:D-glycero-alpha-D-manno-heptose 1-phosphate guanylyltransferase